MNIQDELILALHNLVNLKEHKDKYGKDEFYLNNQLTVWECAKEVLDKCKVKPVCEHKPISLGRMIQCEECGKILSSF